jgi:hypothetical protein
MFTYLPTVSTQITTCSSCYFILNYYFSSKIKKRKCKKKKKWVWGGVFNLPDFQKKEKKEKKSLQIPITCKKIE